MTPIRLISLALLSLLISGCAMAGMAATVLKPPEKVEAKYKPTTQPVAVLVENYHMRGNTTLNVRDTLASYICLELKSNNVGTVVDPYKIYDLRMANPRTFRTMTIDAVGRKVGARQVIYVDLVQAEVAEASGGQVMKGSLTALVKLVDADTGRTLWPGDLQEGYLVTLDTPFTPITETESVEAAREAMSRSAADAIAKLFYTWTMPE